MTIANEVVFERWLISDVGPFLADFRVETTNRAVVPGTIGVDVWLRVDLCFEQLVAARHGETAEERLRDHLAHLFGLTLPFRGRHPTIGCRTERSACMEGTTPECQCAVRVGSRCELEPDRLARETGKVERHLLPAVWRGDRALEQHALVVSVSGSHGHAKLQGTRLDRADRQILPVVRPVSRPSRTTSDVTSGPVFQLPAVVAWLNRHSARAELEGNSAAAGVIASLLSVSTRRMVLGAGLLTLVHAQTGKQQQQREA